MSDKNAELLCASKLVYSFTILSTSVNQIVGQGIRKKIRQEIEIHLYIL